MLIEDKRIKWCFVPYIARSKQSDCCSQPCDRRTSATFAKDVSLSSQPPRVASHVNLVRLFQDLPCISALDSQRCTVHYVLNGRLSRSKANMRLHHTTGAFVRISRTSEVQAGLQWQAFLRRVGTYNLAHAWLSGVSEERSMFVASREPLARKDQYYCVPYVRLPL